MADIVPLHGDDHEEAQSLLPWFVTGRLAADESARVEAHVAACPSCQADLRQERALAAEISALQTETDAGWTRLRARLNPEDRRSRRAHRSPRPPSRPLVRPSWLGWAAAAQAAALLLVVALWAAPQRPAQYHALASPAQAGAAAGNALIMFSPQAREADLRRLLQANGARIVDGPTAAGAYLVRVPQADLARRLAAIRRESVVSLAEPIDGSPP